MQKIRTEICILFVDTEMAEMKAEILIAELKSVATSFEVTVA